MRDLGTLTALLSLLSIAPSFLPHALLNRFEVLLLWSHNTPRAANTAPCRGFFGTVAIVFHHVGCDICPSATKTSFAMDSDGPSLVLTMCEECLKMEEWSETRQREGVGHLENCIGWIAPIFVVEVHMSDAAPHKDVTIITFLIEPNDARDTKRLEQRDISLGRESKDPRRELTWCAYWSTECNELPRNNPRDISVLELGEVVVLEDVEGVVSEMMQTVDAIEGPSTV
jgi:hypothetical protein